MTKRIIVGAVAVVVVLGCGWLGFSSTQPPDCNAAAMPRRILAAVPMVGGCTRAVGETVSRRIPLVAGAAVVLLGLVVAFPAHAGMRAVSATEPGSGRGPVGMTAALQRDLGLSAAQAEARLAAEDVAGRTEQVLRDSLGATFGGAWMDADGGQLVVGITDPGRAGEVLDAGALPRVVTRSARDLDVVVAGLNAIRPPAAVHGWYADVVRNRVVVQADPAAFAAAAAFVKTSGVDAAAVHLEASAGRSRLMEDIRGGDLVGILFALCSIGFSVTHYTSAGTEPGVLTAGHCTAPVGAISFLPADATGTTMASVFPGSDHGWIRITTSNPPLRPWVNRYDGSNASVTGAQVAPVGASVCRSGFTTGWRCGIIQARNVTHVFNGLTVNGLIETNACASPGDSGGPLVSGAQAQTQAQGTLTGGPISTGCVYPTYFQPVLPALLAHNLSLLNTKPMIVSMSCETNLGSVLCSLTRIAGATLTWKVNGVPRNDWTNKNTVSGPCAGTQTTVVATLTNSKGSVSQSRTVACTGGHH
jgi:streptogrisin C